MHFHLGLGRHKALSQIKVEFNFEMWLQLAETTLLAIQIFNGRRAVEIERVFIEDFPSYQLHI